MINQHGQALIEALVAGTLSLLVFSSIFLFGIKIIKMTLDEDQLEEHQICRMIKNDCK